MKAGEFMKKRLLSAFLVTVLAMSITGCGYDNKSVDVSKIDVDSYISNLGNYQGLTVETEKRSVINEDSVQDYIDYVLTNIGSTDTVEVDREAKNGDTVNIDYEGLLDGVAFDGGTAEGYDLTLGSGQFIDGFEDGLIGYKKGDEVALNLTFPENYNSELLAGKAVVFNVKINAVKEPVKPELTDELVGMMAVENIKTVDEFKDYVRDNLAISAEEVYKDKLRDNILLKIYDDTTFASDEVPAEMFNYYLEQVRSSDQAYANQYGVTLADFVPVYYGIEYEEYLANTEEQAKAMVQNVMICEKIARDNNIKITSEEVKRSMEETVEKYNYASLDALKEVTSEEYYKNYLLEKKVTDFILSNCNTTVLDVDSTSKEK